MLQDKSGYNFVPGTAVCLTTSKRKRNRGEKKAMKIVTDTTYERMLKLNVYVGPQKGTGPVLELGPHFRPVLELGH